MDTKLYKSILFRSLELEYQFYCGKLFLCKIEKTHSLLVLSSIYFSCYDSDKSKVKKSAFHIWQSVTQLNLKKIIHSMRNSTRDCLYYTEVLRPVGFLHAHIWQFISWYLLCFPSRAYCPSYGYQARRLRLTFPTKKKELWGSKVSWTAWKEECCQSFTKYMCLYHLHKEFHRKCAALTNGI